jgi:hypothetical protein
VGVQTRSGIVAVANACSPNYRVPLMRFVNVVTLWSAARSLLISACCAASREIAIVLNAASSAHLLVASAQPLPASGSADTVP